MALNYTALKADIMIPNFYHIFIVTIKFQTIATKL